MVAREGSKGMSLRSRTLKGSSTPSSKTSTPKSERKTKTKPKTKTNTPAKKRQANTAAKKRQPATQKTPKSTKFSDSDDENDEGKRHVETRKPAPSNRKEIVNGSDSDSDDDAAPTSVSFSAARETIDAQEARQQEAITSLAEEREQQRKDAFARQSLARERKRKRLSKDLLEQAQRDLEEAKLEEQLEKERKEEALLLRRHHKQFQDTEDSPDELPQAINVDGFTLMNTNEDSSRRPDKSALEFRREHLYGSRVRRADGNISRKKKKFGMAKRFVVGKRKF